MFQRVFLEKCFIFFPTIRFKNKICITLLYTENVIINLMNINKISHYDGRASKRATKIFIFSFYLLNMGHVYLLFPVFTITFDFNTIIQ